MEQFSELIAPITSISICGVSLVTIITVIVYVVKAVHKVRKETKRQAELINVTKESIELAFKNAVLPKTIKLDVSKKIQEPISKAMEELKENNDTQLSEMREELLLCLKILSKFTHCRKLSEEDLEKVEDLVNEEITEDVEI